MVNYRKMSFEQLLAEFDAANAYSAEGLQKQAEIWVAMMETGNDLSPYKTQMSRWYHEIAAKRLAPRAAMLFFTMEPLVQLVMTLVYEEQDALARNTGRCQVVNLEGVERTTRIQDISRVEWARVIVDGRILTADQQRARLPKVPEKAKPATGGGTIRVTDDKPAKHGAGKTMPPAREEPPDYDDYNSDWDGLQHASEAQIEYISARASEHSLLPMEYMIDFMQRHDRRMPQKKFKRATGGKSVRVRDLARDGLRV